MFDTMGVQRVATKEEEEEVPRQQPRELPFDIVAQILLWLPVVSLVRFKCVCKQWCLLIEGYKFIEKHRAQTRYSLPPCYQCQWDKGRMKGVASYGDFELQCDCSGLFLEKSKTSQVCRIRNPATHKVLYLPKAPEGTRVVLDLGFNSLTGECKVACAYRREGSLVGVDVITIGKDEMWRPLLRQKLNFLEQGRWVVKPNCCEEDKVNWAIYISKIVKDEHDDHSCLQIQSLDLWSECLTTTTLPQGAFLNLKNVRAFPWDLCLGVAETVGGAIHILVLEDFKEHKWSRNKIIIPLKNLKVDHTVWTDHLVLTQAHSSSLRFRNGRGQVLSYDMETEDLEVLERSEFLRKRLALRKSTLVTLKGMRLGE
ncbi:putative F-box protein At1g50870 [Pyrus communis]|uniref:putative F-box protein At1g50870 n=1 Tax=Pyrus communis TaxID=23211 RepID=UPI0035C04E89